MANNINKKSITRNIEFLFEIGSIRNIDRVWKQFHIDAANLAEHTFRVVWIALTLARHEKNVDEGKLVTMALMHDLGESRTGDVNYLSRQYTKRDEIKAVKDATFQTVHQNEIVSLMVEYEERKSIESRIIKDADTLDIELELRELEYKGNKLPQLFKKRRNENVYPRLYTAIAKRYWKEINSANPHAWHLNSPANRHNGGDWKNKKGNK